MGLGCWAIGGPAWYEGHPAGSGQVDDAESLRALAVGFEMGVNFLDTADMYGCGHSERVVGQFLKGKRDKIVLATKFGHMHTFDEQSRQGKGQSADPEYIRSACDASLKRLGTDYIDLYQFHLDQSDAGAAVRDALEELVTTGKIRWYGWSTDIAARAGVFAEGPHCCANQFALNVLQDKPDNLAVCQECNLAAINKNPLNRGVLTGKFDAQSKFAENDARHQWDLSQGPQAELLKKLDDVRDILCSSGRTPAQGALCWIWARHEKTIPITGFKTVAQVKENAGAMAFEPLMPDQMKEIDQILDR